LAGALIAAIHLFFLSSLGDNYFSVALGLLSSSVCSLSSIALGLMSLGLQFLLLCSFVLNDLSAKKKSIMASTSFVGFWKWISCPASSIV